MVQAFWDIFFVLKISTRPNFLSDGFLISDSKAEKSSFYCHFSRYFWVMEIQMFIKKTMESNFKNPSDQKLHIEAGSNLKLPRHR